MDDSPACTKQSKTPEVRIKCSFLFDQAHISDSQQKADWKFLLAPLFSVIIHPSFLCVSRLPAAAAQPGNSEVGVIFFPAGESFVSRSEEKPP